MTEKFNAKKIKETWAKMAVDYDYNLDADNIKNCYSEASWSDKTFENICVGFEFRFKEFEDFFDEHDYRWVLDRESYDFIAEPLYQLTVLDVLIGNWLECSASHKKDAQFDNVCARQIMRWGSKAVTPRAPKAYKGLKVVVVPYGWDDAVQHIIRSALDYTGQYFDFPISEGMERDKKPEPKTPEAVVSALHGDWNALITKTYADVFEVHDVFVPDFAMTLAEKIPKLCSDRVIMQGEEQLSRSVVYSHLAHIYAVAHEVGHHLRGCNSNFDFDDIEVSADRYALYGLWNCQWAYEPYIAMEAGCMELLVLSGLLFYDVLIVFSIASAQCSGALGESPYIDSKDLEQRFNHWYQCALQLSSAAVVKDRFIPRLSAFQNHFISFTKQFSSYSEERFLDTAVQAQALFKAFSSSSEYRTSLGELNEKAAGFKFSEKD